MATICEEHGHLYHAAAYTFARNSAGKTTRCDFVKQAKYMIYVCNRCLDTKEIQVAPPIEIMPGPSLPPNVPLKNIARGGKSTTPTPTNTPLR